MAAPAERELIAVIGDEDSVTGLLLAGIGHVSGDKRNFMVVGPETTPAEIEETFNEFVNEWPEIAIVLINQHVADLIRARVDEHEAAFPSVLEIPSKDHPYDPTKDSVLKRVEKLMQN